MESKQKDDTAMLAATMCELTLTRGKEEETEVFYPLGYEKHKDGKWYLILSGGNVDIKEIANKTVMEGIGLDTIAQLLDEDAKNQLLWTINQAFPEISKRSDLRLLINRWVDDNIRYIYSLNIYL